MSNFLGQENIEVFPSEVTIISDDDNFLGQEEIEVALSEVSLSLAQNNERRQGAAQDDENSIWNNFDIAWCTNSIIRAYVDTIKGALPYNRNFGLPFDMVDKAQGVAYAMLVTDVASNLNKYVSGVEIARIDVEAEDNGVLRPRLAFKGI